MAEAYPSINNSILDPTLNSSQNTEFSPPNSNLSSGSGIVGAPNSMPNSVVNVATTSNLNNLTNTAKSTGSVLETQPILTRPRLQELVREVDPTEQLDEEVEELLLQIADDFVEDAVKAACSYAKHRKNSKIEVKDVQLHLEKKWNMWIPGFGTDELKPYKRAAMTEAHKQRLALIRKTIKKY